MPRKQRKKASGGDDLLWKQISFNKRVEKDMNNLQRREPEKFDKMILHLISNANVPVQCKKSFKMKYYNAYEYRLTLCTERIYYVLDSINHLVVVYYAGEHPRKTPYPPKALNKIHINVCSSQRRPP